MACMCLNALYMILFKWEIYLSGLVLYEILKWVSVCVWRLFVWYYLNDGLYVPECALWYYWNDRCMCLWALYVIIYMRAYVCLNAL